MSPESLAFTHGAEAICVKCKDVQKDYLQRFEELKKRLYSEFSWLSGRDLSQLLSKMGHYHYDRKGLMLVGEDRDLYDFLMKNGYNPYTVYRWALLERVPEEIRQKLKENKIGQKKAISEAYVRKREAENKVFIGLHEMGLTLIRGM